MAEKIAVIGAGSWGTAIAKIMAEKGHKVILWSFEPEVAQTIEKTHKNPLFLTDVKLPNSIKTTTDLALAIEGCSLAVSVVPSQNVRGIWASAAKYLPKASLLVSCSKGIETDSLKLMHEVLIDCLPNHPKENFTALSGPSFAKEVAMGLPTSVVIAGENATACKKVQDIFRTTSFLTFTHDDVIGVEVGGAVKNVIAIATGISDGMGFGHNSRATIITRGLYEMIKIGAVLGANPLTFSGLSGIGDLVLTCTADLSRNHTLGKLLGEGKNLNDITKNMKMVAEGVATSKSVHKLAKRHNLNTPICDIVYQILFEGLSPSKAVTKLCEMKLTNELGAFSKELFKLSKNRS